MARFVQGIRYRVDIPYFALDPRTNAIVSISAFGERGIAVDEEQARRLNEEAQKYAESTVECYETLWDQFARAQEGQAWLAQGVFEGTIAHLRTQSERNLDVSEELVEQARKGQETAGQIFAQGSAKAYTQFLDSLFFYYRESARAAERSTRDG
jgi:hypothetical protein